MEALSNAREDEEDRGLDCIQLSYEELLCFFVNAFILQLFRRIRNQHKRLLFMVPIVIFCKQKLFTHISTFRNFEGKCARND
jgi:hypothetical protein